MKRLISSIVSKDEVVRLFHRFPLTCIFSILFSSELIYDILTDTEPNGVTIFYLLTGALLSFVLHLWGEEVKNRKVAHSTMLVANVLLLIDAIVLWHLKDKDFDEALFIAHGAVIFAMALAAIFLPFYKESDDIQSWNFSRSIIFWVAISAAISVAMYIGTAILISGCNFLFFRNFDRAFRTDFNKLYPIFAVFYFCLLAMAIFLSHVPKGAKKHDSTIVDSRFVNRVARYLFLPLVLCYMVVLYLYLAKIIFTWELPRGTVSWLVSAMMVIILIIEVLVYPAMQSSEERPFERRMVRWLPILALPLVMLMTIGIIRRFSDYGLTSHRLYIATLNVWFYLVCIGLYLTRARRIHWIPLSFAFILLITSAQPLNYTKIGKLWGSEDRPRVTKDDDLGFGIDNQEKVYLDFSSRNDEIILPEGYRKMVFYRWNYTSTKGEADKMMADSIFNISRDFEIEGVIRNLQFDVPVAQLRQLEAETTTPIYFQEKTVGDSIIMIPTKLYARAYSYVEKLDDDSEVYIEGSSYIFIK